MRLPLYRSIRIIVNLQEYTSALGAGLYHSKQASISNIHDLGSNQRLIIETTVLLG